MASCRGYRAAFMAAAAPDPDRFRAVIGHFPTGVTIVTCQGPAGPAGLTTNAVTALSLDPLLLVVCFDRRSRTLSAVRHSGRFAVNVLRADQERLARTFASKRVAAEKFESVAHTPRGGVPVLDDVLAWVTCELRDLHDGGDHVIAVGSVTDMDADPDGEPLVFFRGRYVRIVDVPTSFPASAAPGTR
jgi:3-hydroxy-9,10-secoandrosta-1,3,5(10)-triene-9,17-dione monooxygenase reductase component